jgi:hypothetical protein
MQMDMRGRGTLGSLPRYQLVNAASKYERDLLDCARETLVALRVIILQTNLEFHRLDKFALLFAVGFGK